jgi:hypothetical protein
LTGQLVFRVIPKSKKVGTIDDVILDEAMRVIGFRLLRVFVEGPIAERRAAVREAVIEAGDEDKVMIIDLGKAERQSLGPK